ncbi:hypothetical protein [Streptomyces roseolus]|uniref:hypothetical protein n=1 Tax=Streptomyces roseolus TaxID=67358 RepID=UPI00167A8992|nr:hypothetical protein [Streptomyces roseolus]GGR51561.1 hypothetical protein GCM10010282_50600 [Streptomyces roseolus]
MKRIVIEYENKLKIRHGGAFSGDNPSLIFHDSEYGEVFRLNDLEVMDASPSDDVVWFEVTES